MMGKIINLVLMVFLMIGVLGFVTAEYEDVVPEPERVGFFSNQMFKMKMVFTFDKEKKIDLALGMAERRLAEAELLASEDPEAYAVAQERYDELIARAERILEEIESGAEDVNSSVDRIGKIARIQNQFERHRDHADEIYGRALERFDANNASAEKLERFEIFHDRALNRSYVFEKKILERKENTLKKHKALSEASDEELETLIADIESNEGLTQAREIRMEQARERIVKLRDRDSQKVEQMRARLENADMSEAQKEQLRQRVENTESRLAGIEDNAGKKADALKNAAGNELAGRNR